MLKKLTAILLTSIMVLSGTVMSFAEMDLRAPEVCNGKSYHEMISKGWGFVYLSNGSTYLNGAPTYQCAGCYKVMVSETDPYDIKEKPDLDIGKYVLHNVYYPVSNNGVVINGPEIRGYHSSNKMDGFRFFLYQSRNLDS